jgi:hypothetical protein
MGRYKPTVNWGGVELRERWTTKRQVKWRSSCEKKTILRLLQSGKFSYPRWQPRTTLIFKFIFRYVVLFKKSLTSNAMLHLHTGSSEDKKWRITEFPNIRKRSVNVKFKQIQMYFVLLVTVYQCTYPAEWCYFSSDRKSNMGRHYTIGSSCSSGLS